MGLAGFETALEMTMDRPAQTAVAVSLGFIPLTDAAPLVIADEFGWFAEAGLDVTLVREASWATMRDKVAVGALDAGHMLAAIPLATSLGVGGLKRAMIAPMSLGQNGNAITLSTALWAQVMAVDAGAATDPLIAAQALAAVVRRRAAAGQAPLTFASVFAVSMHAYQLRDWLILGGLDPETEVRHMVVPPPQMVAHLERGLIDGYCVGEPWNTVAVSRGLGRIAVSGHALWPAAPEKVLATSLEWATAHPQALASLMGAILRACRWLDAPANRPIAAEILARPDRFGLPVETIAPSLIGQIRFGIGEAPRSCLGWHRYFDGAASFPWVSHAAWFLTEMLRWGQITHPIAIQATAADVYRPDLYRPVAHAHGVAYPTTDSKVEAAHDRPWTLSDASTPIAMAADVGLNARSFDPSDPVAHLSSHSLHRRAIDLDALAAAQPPR